MTDKNLTIKMGEPFTLIDDVDGHIGEYRIDRNVWGEIRCMIARDGTTEIQKIRIKRGKEGGKSDA